MFNILCLLEEPKNLLAYIALSAAHDISCREEEARAHVAEALRVNPQLSIEILEQIIPFKETAILEGMGDNLRKAGLK